MFIKLTFTHQSQPVVVNTEKITQVAIYDKDNARGSYVRFSNQSDDYLVVKESPSGILAMMEKKG